MKKAGYVILLLAALLLAAIYLFIPSTIHISQSVIVHANKEPLYRKLSVPASWAEWWPGSKTSDSSFSLNGFIFSPGHAKAVSIPVTIEGKRFRASSEFTFLHLSKDSVTLHAETTLPASFNPFKRVKVWLASRKIRLAFTSLLESVHNKYATPAALYGYDIKKQKVVDSTLVFTSAEVKGFPDTEKIYSLIDELKSYIAQQAARETGFPMLNIFTQDSSNYSVKVAIPVDRKLPDSGKFRYRWMLGGGNILITEVKGGPGSIRQAYEQTLQYISDYQRTAPAIPFESLVTDRRKEPDSSKWITRVYYPVM